MANGFDSDWLNRHHARHTIRRQIKDGVAHEVDLHNDIIEECRHRGWPYLHGAMSAATHRTLGEPDFIIPIDGGHTLYVECKTRVGKLSPAQAAFSAQMLRFGHTVHVVRTFQEFLALCPRPNVPKQTQEP